MKVRIEVDETVQETEVLIKTAEITDEIKRIQDLLKKESQQWVFYKQLDEYYFPIQSVLFFETDEAKVFAHTAKDVFEVKHRLYALEELLPSYFMRVSKSTLINVKEIYALTRSFSGTAVLAFRGTHKQVHVSRQYYKLLKEKMSEVR